MTGTMSAFVLAFEAVLRWRTAFACVLPATTGGANASARAAANAPDGSPEPDLETVLARRRGGAGSDLPRARAPAARHRARRRRTGGGGVGGARNVRRADSQQELRRRFTGGSMDAWLGAIARRKSLEHLRRRPPARRTPSRAAKRATPTSAASARIRRPSRGWKRAICSMRFRGRRPRGAGRLLSPPIPRRADPGPGRGGAGHAALDAGGLGTPTIGKAEALHLGEHEMTHWWHDRLVDDYFGGRLQRARRGPHARAAWPLRLLPRPLPAPSDRRGCDARR